MHYVLELDRDRVIITKDGERKGKRMLLANAVIKAAESGSKTQKKVKEIIRNTAQAQVYMGLDDDTFKFTKELTEEIGKLLKEV